MKTSTQNKILLSTLLLGVWVSSSGFGLVEPTTVLENRRHKSEMRADSSQSLERLKWSRTRIREESSNNSNQDSDDSDKK
jgi:hypothetical protein